MTVNIASCSEHGLHGSRLRCYECGDLCDQIEMVPVTAPLAERVSMADIDAISDERLRAAIDEENVGVLIDQGPDWREQGFRRALAIALGLDQQEEPDGRS